MADEMIPTPGLVLFQPRDGGEAIRVRIEGETVWLTQAQMTDLFQTTRQNISLHLRNIFDDKELEQAATVKQYLTVQTEGSRRVERLIDHYSLDAIIAVGYRIRSARGTVFRQWATAQLRDLLVMGTKCRYRSASRPAMPLPNGTHTLMDFSMRGCGAWAMRGQAPLHGAKLILYTTTSDSENNK